MFDAKELLNILAGSQIGSGGAAAGSAVGGALDRGKEVASDVATKAGAAVSDALAHAEAHLKGTQAGEYIGKAKDLSSQNPTATGLVLGGLAAILLGTQGGRAVTGATVRLGGLAAIGGLAYKALRNYQDGKPLTAGMPGLEQLTAAPQDSSFSEDSHTHETALLMIRAMVATAASDGVVDASQRAKILGEMKGAGLAADAAQFLDHEIQNPATAAELAESVGHSRDLALQVYAAAHLVAATAPERAFLEQLAQALHLDNSLVAQLNAASQAVAPPAG